ncbi:hypothetical protein [Microcoleus sp. BROC3]|uniref:hypothetical protein n=1 Tax=Microcoleus sp. BROC3 TaxID=3055323 RepID=UPI002FD0B3A4
MSQTRLGSASKGFVNLGELGSRGRSHSDAISFVTNIDFVRVAPMGDILPDRIWEIYRLLAATHLGMIILLCGGNSKFWAMALAQGLRGSNLIGEGQGIDFFIVISELFKVGIVW